MLRALVVPLALMASPALASFYSAQPQAAPAQHRFVARDNVWNCAGTACASGRTPSRPAIVCSTLARQVGALTRFTVEGRDFTAEELAACNARAR